MSNTQICAIYDLFISAGIEKRAALYKTAGGAGCDIQTVAVALFFRDCE